MARYNRKCKEVLSIRRGGFQDYQHPVLMLPTSTILKLNQLIHLLVFSAKYRFVHKKQLWSPLLSMAGSQEFHIVTEAERTTRSLYDQQTTIKESAFQQEWELHLSPSFISLRKRYFTLNCWEKHAAILTVEQAIKIQRGGGKTWSQSCGLGSGIGHPPLPTKVLV